jgi:Protein of unknown function (DUF429)
MTRVVLAAAHLDSDPTNNRLKNLRALCQRHDRPHHLAQRWITYRRRSAVGNLFLGPYPALIAAPPEVGSRSSETELGRLGLSSFKTPAKSDWADIREKCAQHLRSGGSTASLPHANKIWMLFGFELFSALRSGVGAEVIEVYPFAIVRALLPSCEHKSTEQGYRDQLTAVADRTGWKPPDLEARLKATVPGSQHDRLDAYMAAWVASLTPEQRRASRMTRSGCLRSPARRLQ